MPRPSQIDEQRKRLLPIVCEVFSELGYHRTTTAELAQRCGVRENILYRLWQDKKAMFLAAIDDIFQSRAERWGEILAERPTPEEAAEALVAYEAKHQGEFGFYRVVFTALVEADDPEIREAITGMYRRFHERIRRLIDASREGDECGPWAFCRRDRMGHDRPGDRFQYHPGVGTAAAQATRGHVRCHCRSIWSKGDSP